MRELTGVVLQAPTRATAAGVTGTYKDLSALIGPSHRELAFSLLAGKGTTSGTCGGRVQTAVNTSGPWTTLITFDTQTSAGGDDEHFGVPPANHRYGRFLGSVQTGKDMFLACVAFGKARVV